MKEGVEKLEALGVDIPSLMIEEVQNLKKLGRPEIMCLPLHVICKKNGDAYQVGIMALHDKSKTVSPAGVHVAFSGTKIKIPSSLLRNCYLMKHQGTMR